MSVCCVFIAVCLVQCVPCCVFITVLCVGWILAQWLCCTVCCVHCCVLCVHCCMLCIHGCVWCVHCCVLCVHDCVLRVNFCVLYVHGRTLCVHCCMLCVHCVVLCVQVDISKVVTLCKLLEALLFPARGGPDMHADPVKLHVLVCTTFVFCYIWSIGGNLLEKYWDAFDTFVRNQFDDNGEAKVRTAATQQVHVGQFCDRWSPLQCCRWQDSGSPCYSGASNMHLPLCTYRWGSL